MLKNQVLDVIARYTLSNGEQYYNYKFGSRYYWTNVKAFRPEIEIAKKDFARTTLKMVNAEYNAFNTPEHLFNAKQLLYGQQLLNQSVQGIAQYTLSDGSMYYNFKFGSRYYWVNSDAFEVFPEIQQRRNINQLIRFNSSDYGAYNTPEKLLNAHQLLSGHQLIDRQVRACAVYQLSNGESYYNYKLGDRYYWTNTRAFKNEIVVSTRQNITKTMMITGNNIALTNTPATLFGAKELLNSNAVQNKVITVVAKYSLSDGTHYYNFKYGSRYYWLDERALTDVAVITAKEKMALKVEIISNQYGAYNTPAPLTGAKLLLHGQQLVGSTVTVIARYKISNGEWYYNYKLGNRYYWSDSRAFAKYGATNISVPIYINQYKLGVPNACEAASLFMALKSKGKLVGYSFSKFLKQMPISKDLNPYQGFGGSVYANSNGFPAIFPVPLTKWGNRYGNVINLSGQSVTDIKDHLNLLHPVVAFVTIHFQSPLFSQYWWGTGVNNNHAVLVDGYRAGSYHVSDPIDGQYWVNAKTFESVYNSRKWGLAVID
ncbi:MAG: GW dipeptide domain-containing protein [Lactobacillaceae bacterium]|jgi:uncharacterized protein YvpB|nr:GW dipeptide domain-containing protein [Lactobacillaceae bacterium]